MKKDYKENKISYSGFLAEGATFKGILSFKGTFRIDCKFEGEIISSDILIVGEKAEISAEISVGSAYINGKLVGNMTANDRIEIKSSGEVYGNLMTPILVIDEGVIFEGNCKMRKKESKEGKLSVIPSSKS